jgi:colanic acid/amylovoran biosynthesis protein
MANILLTNVHSFHNTGDAALTLMAIRQLKESFPGSRITLVMNDPDSYSGDEQVQSSIFTWLKQSQANGKDRWNTAHLLWLIPAALIPVLSYRLFKKASIAFTPAALQPMLRAYLQADLVVSTPGGFLYSSGRGTILILSLFTLALALLAGKPLYFMPQSYGPYTHTWECALVRSILDKARIVMAREEISLNQLQKCGVANKRCMLTPDLAFAAPGASPDEAQKWLQNHGVQLAQDTPRLGITVINWGAQFTPFKLQERYEKSIAAAARYFIEQTGGKAIFFPQVRGPAASQDDRIPARRIASQLSDLAESVVLIEEAPDPAVLKSIYAQMDLFMGTRMHSNIFAMSEGVPLIAIGYLHKTLGITRMAGLEAWAIDIQQVEETSLVKLLKDLWAQKSRVRAQLRQSMPSLVAQANGAGRAIAEDYAQYVSRGAND